MTRPARNLWYVGPSPQFNMLDESENYPPLMSLLIPSMVSISAKIRCFTVWRQSLDVEITLDSTSLCCLKRARRRETSNCAGCQMYYRYWQHAGEYCIPKSCRVIGVSFLNVRQIDRGGREGWLGHHWRPTHPPRRNLSDLVSQQQHSCVPQHAISYLPL